MSALELLRRRKDVLLIALIFLASRAVILAGYMAGKHGSLYEAIGAAGGSYDASWFERVVRWGYWGSSVHYPVASFYPGYPLVVDVVFWPVIGIIKLFRPDLSVDTIYPHDVLSGSMVLVANLALIVALVLLWKLYQPRLGTTATIVGLALLLSFPVSFFLSSGFSESLFIACIAAAFLFVERGQWVKVGVAAGLACLVRFPGVFVALPLVVAWLQARPRPPVRQSVLGACLLLAGAIAYPLFLWIAFGDPLFYFHLQIHGPWQHQVLNPLASIGDIFGQAREGERAIRGIPTIVRPVDAPAALMQAIAVSIGLLAIVFAWKSRLRSWEVLWVGLVLLFPLLVGFASLSRYMLAAFPVFFLFGTWFQRWPTLVIPVLVASGVFLFILTETMARGFFVA